METKQFENMQYLISHPEDSAGGKKYPLIIFLHGAGTRGDDVELLKSHAGFRNICAHAKDRFAILAPLCGGKNWNEVMSCLIELVDTVRHLDFVDSKRVYLTGNSMGGYGTWELTSLRPDWFAAVMPLCGGGLPWMTWGFRHVPVRAFHGLQDAVVDPIESLEMVKRLNRSGGYGELILFPDLEHNCWERVYDTEENYEWLLRFTTDREKNAAEQLTGEKYG